jgi:hypothetical protein
MNYNVCSVVSLVLRANGVQNAKVERTLFEDPHCFAYSIIQISLTVRTRYRKGQ